jgi:hypothetical protein
MTGRGFLYQTAGIPHVKKLEMRGQNDAEVMRFDPA